MTRVSKWVPGESLGGYTLTDLEYVDDTALFAKTVNHLQDALTSLKEAKKHGLMIKWPKTEPMHVDDS